MPDTIATNRRKVSEYSDLALVINGENMSTADKITIFFVKPFIFRDLLCGK